MAWLGFGQTLLVRFLAGRNRSATVFHFQARLRSSTDVTDHIVQKQPRSDLVLTDCPFFYQTDPVHKQAGVQESAGPLLANVSEPIRFGCETEPACLLGMSQAVASIGTYSKQSSRTLL